MTTHKQAPDIIPEGKEAIYQADIYLISGQVLTGMWFRDLTITRNNYVWENCTETGGNDPFSVMPRLNWVDVDSSAIIATVTNEVKLIDLVEDDEPE